MRWARLRHKERDLWRTSAVLHSTWTIHVNLSTAVLEKKVIHTCIFSLLPPCLRTQLILDCRIISCLLQTCFHLPVGWSRTSSIRSFSKPLMQQMYFFCQPNIDLIIPYFKDMLCIIQSEVAEPALENPLFSPMGLNRWLNS